MLWLPSACAQSLPAALAGADHLTDGIRHMLWSAAPLRATVVVPGGLADARQQLAANLASAKSLIGACLKPVVEQLLLQPGQSQHVDATGIAGALQPEHLMPPCLLAPAGDTPVTVRGDGAADPAVVTQRPRCCAAHFLFEISVAQAFHIGQCKI